MSLSTALKTGDLTQLPSRKDEDWKWTDLRGLIRQAPEPSERIVGDPSKGPIGRYGAQFGAGPFSEVADRSITMVNGEREHLTLHSNRKAVSIALRFVSSGPGSHTGGAVINVSPGTHAILLESYEAFGDGYVCAIELDIRLGVGASLERVILATDGPAAVSVSQAKVVLGARAEFAQTVLTSGARRQRIETHVAHPGHGARARLDGVYLLSEQRHADLTTVVAHAGVDGATDQLTKGCVRDQARGVFQGRITVARGADGTDARMGHHALILSERAEVDSKPELEIYADDVACTHGNTVGALDEEALFYMQQRGLPEAQARTLLTEAFVGEVIDRIEHEGARDVARAWVAERLRAVS